MGFDNEDKGEGSQEANVTAARIKSVSVERVVSCQKGGPQVQTKLPVIKGAIT